MPLKCKPNPNSFSYFTWQNITCPDGYLLLSAVQLEILSTYCKNDNGLARREVRGEFHQQHRNEKLMWFLDVLDVSRFVALEISPYILFGKTVATRTKK